MAEADKIETREILNLLYDHFEKEGQRYVCADEVGDVPCGANRRMDFVAVDCWSSGGFDISVFEIKISKSDLRHDLEDPSKHNIFFDQVDRFSIIAPDYVLDAEYRAMIPPKWGIVSVSRGKDADGKDCLKWRNVRKPMALVDDAQVHRTFNRAFAASLIRRVVAKLERNASYERARIRDEAYREGQATRGGTNWEALYREAQEELRGLRELSAACGMYRYDKDRVDSLAKIVQAARDTLSDAGLLESAAEQLQKYTRHVVSSVRSLRKALETGKQEPAVPDAPENTIPMEGKE